MVAKRIPFQVQWWFALYQLVCKSFLLYNWCIFKRKLLTVELNSTHYAHFSTYNSMRHVFSHPRMIFFLFNKLLESNCRNRYIWANESFGMNVSWKSNSTSDCHWWLKYLGRNFWTWKWRHVIHNIRQLFCIGLIGMMKKKRNAIELNVKQM